ncbi:tyrosine-protein kinase Yes-like isoform X2 [Watersipora subatra]|uniref:tyrosine-protein kinase Yes-like isoform X2 n=1 Tax=Watersipora subatra TaxID=2589382 RepID=UPI00355C1CF2
MGNSCVKNEKADNLQQAGTRTAQFGNPQGQQVSTLQAGQRMKTKVVKALFDYEPQTDEDLAFKKGDRMMLIGDCENQDWWFAKNTITKDEGYIPRNFVVEDNAENLKSYDWFFEMDRREADKELMLPGNPQGTFLVRCASDGSSLALSIRDFDQRTNDFTVKHYKIRTMDRGGCFIAPKRTFAGVVQLVNHYKEYSDGLCCKLGLACPKERPVVAFRELEINRKGIKLIKKLGAGHFGEVWSGKWKALDVAVKSLKPGKMSKEEFLAEAKVMHKLQHRHLVLILAVCTEMEPIYIITELMTNGAFLDFLRNDDGLTLRLPTLMDMAAQIASGMMYLEKENFIHRDLRAANILVGDNHLVKVADFGLARALDHHDNADDDDVYLAQEGTKFPIKWTAPEAAFERKFSVKSDVWSMGVLLYEMTTFGKVPYPGMYGREVLEQIEQGYRMPKPRHDRLETPDTLYDIMKKCWDRRPENRPTFEYLYNFFDDYFVSTEPNYKDPMM